MSDQDPAESKGKSSAQAPGGEEPDNTSTTLTTRKWASIEMDDFQNLFATGEGRKVLPPDLFEFAEKQMFKKGAWARWLMWGLAVKIARRWVEQELAAKNSSESTAAEPVAVDAKKTSRKKP